MANDRNDQGFFEDRSAFGGMLLRSVRGVNEDTVRKLETLGFTDVEQVVAVAAVEATRPHLEKALGAKQSAELLKTLRGEISDAKMMMMAEAPAVPMSLGALEPDEEVRSMIEAAAPPALLEAPIAAPPPSVNHALKMPPIRSQGNRGTCVAFSMTAMHEFYRSQSGTPQDLSEQFLYHATKQIDGAPGSCGTYAVKAAQVLTNTGECRESVWAYNPAPPCNNNGVMPPNAPADAASYKVQAIILNPKDVVGLKNVLASGRVCEFSIPVYDSWYLSAATRQSGRITMRLGSEPVHGGHAMCLIGYQDDAGAPGGGYFILRNSWGQLWGASCPYGAGNGTIPYAYLANDGWEAVTTVVPRRRITPWDRWRYRPIFGEEQPGPQEGRRTIIIEAGDADIIIR
jgi:hypothetical protein